jgi:VIT1/CCC1 family predicted Fe2+/Mn2+ transporter
MQPLASPPTVREEAGDRPTRRILEPMERIAEVLFGLVMVLTFTGSLSAAEAGRVEIRTMLYGALGCNLAWGLVDSIMYLMARLSGRAESLRTALAVRGAPNAEAARRAIADALPPAVASVLPPAALEEVREHLTTGDLPPRPRLVKDDWLGAIGVFLLVFLCTFPVVIPFVVMQDAVRALRVSNAIAVGLLFLTGFAFGRNAGMRPWQTGLATVLLGAALVGLTILLGG